MIRGRVQAGELTSMRTFGTVGREFSALARVALSLARRSERDDDDEELDAEAPHLTPVMFVHGFLGHPTNFLALRSFLRGSGLSNHTSFSYGATLDYEGLAWRLARAIGALCNEAGVACVDVVGHSLGGVIARHLVEDGSGARIRRLVTLGAPHYNAPVPELELAIYGAEDPIAPPRHDSRAGCRIAVVSGCGHVALLYHPAVHRAVGEFLTAPSEEAAIPAALAAAA